MRKLALAAVLVLAAPAAALAVSGFNPGTVVGNVYENAPPGCVFGFGYSGPGCSYDQPAPRYRSNHRVKAIPAHKVGNGTS
jgi:hypothetical protein